jgi:ketosteroid isomerase-like protein
MSFRGFIEPFLGTLLALLAVPAHSSAQTITAQQRQDRAIATELDIDSQELITLEKETAHALSLNNSSFFDHVYSDDYVGIAATGELRNKLALVAGIQNSTVRYTTFVATNISVRVYGPSAVVTCTWTTRGVNQEGHNFSRQYRVIHVYVNNSHIGGWKVVAGQETMLPG